MRGSALLDPLLDRLFVRAQVAAVEPITPRMRLIRLTGPALGGLAWRPGQQVRVNVQRLALRTYSVWSRAGDDLELCVLDHGDGPGARWAGAVAPGDRVAFRGPEGTFTPAEDAPYHLFAGEETASVAFGAMLGALPPDTPVHGAIEVATDADRLPLPRAAELTWRHRGDSPAAGSATLLQAVRDLDLPPEPGAAYLAGEARTIQAIRAHLVQDRGWPRRAVRTKPFWTPGKRGME